MFKLTIYLIKQSVDSLADVFSQEYREDLLKIKVDGASQAVIAIKDPEPSTPDWFKYFQGKLPEDSLQQSMTNPSALLAIKVEDRFYAISFGYGRYLLNDSSLVPDFGLKVCLNLLSGDKIKTVDTRTLEQMGINTRQQATSPSDFNTFSIETERDLIKAVDGHVEHSIGSYLKGSTSLTLVTSKGIELLAKLCAELLTLYRKQTYKNEFGWVDNIKYVLDPIKINELNSHLTNDLRIENLKSIFLGAPEITDDGEINFYKFSGMHDKATYKIFPSAKQLITSLKAKISRENKREKTDRDIELRDITDTRVTAFNRNDNASQIYGWRIYDCLHAEIIKDGKTFKLLDGNWYEINDNYLSLIENRVSAIPQCNVNLPHMNLGEAEEEYNKRAAAHLNALCMDQDFVQIEGRSKFEFCDIFTQDKEIIHVKKHLGASAISHLLYQGHVSGQLFSHDRRVREDLSKKKNISGTAYARKFNPANFNSSDYQIVFVIASERNKPLKNLLSFFSKISLAHKHKVLSGMGYKVSYKIIAIK